jgi:hypothetical protein
MNDQTKIDDVTQFSFLRNRNLIFSVAGIALVGVIAGSVWFYKSITAVKPRFVEGVHFKILDKPYSAKIGQLDNYYWLNCDSCFMFEPVLKVLTRDAPLISVNKIHATSSDLWLDDSKLDTSLRAVGRLDLLDEFFAMSIKQKGFTKNRVAINDFLSRNKVDPEQFWQEYGSPSSLAQAIDRSKNSDKVGIRVIPTFVLDGKYKVLLGGLKSNEELSDLVKFLEETQPAAFSAGAK